MAKIKGICKNIDGCDLAAEKVEQEAEKSNFICSECGKPLYPVNGGKTSGGNSGPNKKLIAIIAGAIVALGIICALIFGGGSSEEPKTAIPVDSTTVAKDTAKVDTVLIQKTDTIRDTVKIVNNNTTSVTTREKVVTTQTQKRKVQSNTPAQTAGKGTVNLGYGTYKGDLKDGKPHGDGVITYTSSHRIIPSNGKYVASPGDKYEGQFRDGIPCGGYWHHDGDITYVK